MQHWLKLWGDAKKPYGGSRTAALPHDHLTFGGTTGRPRIAEGDKLIILGVGLGGKLVAVVEADSAVEKKEVPHRWPYRCEAHIELLVTDLARAPNVAELPNGTNLVRWLSTTRGYRRLTPAQYETAVRLITSAGGQRPKPR